MQEKDWSQACSLLHAIVMRGAGLVVPRRDTTKSQNVSVIQVMPRKVTDCAEPATCHQSKYSFRTVLWICQLYSAIRVYLLGLVVLNAAALHSYNDVIDYLAAVYT